MINYINVKSVLQMVCWYLCMTIRRFIASVSHNHIFVSTAAASKAVSIECRLLIYESLWAWKSAF